MRRARSLCLLGLLGLAVIGAACTSEPPEPLLIDGSTGVHALITALADTYRSEYPERPIDVSQGLDPVERLDALAARQIDLAMASHGLAVERLAERSLTAHRFARIPIVMAVHESIPPPSLTGEEICAIYAGEITNWQTLGGPDLPIAPRIRPFAEVDAEVLAEHVPCLTQIDLAPTVIEHARSGQMARDLAETTGAIGMTTLARVEQSNDALHVVRYEGLGPDDDAYPLWRDAFLVTRDDASEAVLHFLRFVGSDEAAAVLRANGAVPDGSRAADR